jgi:hypothetical protein
MRGENFIYFSASCGFFVGIIFSILHELSFENFLFVTILITAVFYLLALASISFFVKYLDIKKVIYFDKHEIDSILDIQIRELEKKEDFIHESYEFIKQIEQEEINFVKNKS